MSSTFFQRWVTILLLTTSFTCIRAQEYKYEIGGMAGGAFYMGDVNKTALFKELNPGLGLVFRYNANFRIAFKGNFAWAKVTGTTEGLDNKFPNQLQTSFDRNLFELGGQFEFNFFPYSDKFAYLNTKRLSPYVLVGLGTTVAPGDETFVGLNVPVGVGVKYKLKNRLNLGGEWTFRKLFGDGLDNEALNDPYQMNGGMLKNKDWYSFFMLSLTWDFGPRNGECNNADSIVF